MKLYLYMTHNENQPCPFVQDLEITLQGGEKLHVSWEDEEHMILADIERGFVTERILSTNVFFDGIKMQHCLSSLKDGACQVRVRLRHQRPMPMIDSCRFFVRIIEAGTIWDAPAYVYPKAANVISSAR